MSRLPAAAALALAALPALAATPADDAWQAAENLRADGRYAEAAEGYAAFAREHASDGRAPEARFRGTECLFLSGDLEGALDGFRGLRRDPRAAFREANALYLLRRYRQAGERLKALLKRKGLPGELRAATRYFLARSLLLLGRTEEAEEVAGGERPSGPSAAYLELARGDCLAARSLADPGPGGRAALASARRAYEDALGATDRGRLVPETLFRIGELLRRAGHPNEALKRYLRAAEEYPRSAVSPYARLGAAWSALAAGEADRSAAEAARAGTEAREPALAEEAAFARGTALLAAGRHEEASRVLEALAREAPASVPPARLLLRLAWASLAAGRTELLLATLRRLGETELAEEERAEARFLRAELDLASGRHGDAAGGFARAAAGAGPLAVLAEYRRGEALAASGSHGDAAVAFREFAREHAEHALADAAVARAGSALLRAGEADRAAELLASARPRFRGRPEEPEVLWGSALAEYLRGDYPAMARHARELVEGHEASPRSADAAYWLGWWSLERKELESAVARFDEAAALAGKHDRGDLAAEATLEAASALERLGRRDDALQLAHGLVTGPLAGRAPLEAALWVAAALREAGRDGDAARVLDAALERAGDGEIRARVLYARAELERESDEPDRALDLYDEVIEAGPEDLRAAALLGRARCLSGPDPAAAEVVLENLVRGTSGWARASAYVELGRLHLGAARAAGGEERPELASRAARDFMFVVVLYEPTERGEGSRLAARALLGAAEAYSLLGRYAVARDRIEELLSSPILAEDAGGGPTAEAEEARRLLAEVGLKAEGIEPEAPGPGNEGPGGEEDR